jgi:hypothetical protein
MYHMVNYEYDVNHIFHVKVISFYNYQKLRLKIVVVVFLDILTYYLNLYNFAFEGKIINYKNM